MMDFSGWLFVAGVVTGVIWLIDSWFFATARVQKQISLGAATKTDVKEPLIVEYSKSLFPVILIVFILRSFIVEPFRIPSGSMVPTLEVGDFILVNKFSYGVRLPVLDQKVVTFEHPKKGDVVVFRYPPNPKVDYIKRVIGVPGDVVAYHNKRLTVNGEEVPLESAGTSPDEARFGELSTKRFTERLGSQTYQVQHMDSRPPLDGEVVVPEGKYFVMGDNRDNSRDSRYWGYVPEQNIIGRAFMIWMNWDIGESLPKWRRIGTIIE